MNTSSSRDQARWVQSSVLGLAIQLATWKVGNQGYVSPFFHYYHEIPEVGQLHKEKMFIWLTVLKAVSPNSGALKRAQGSYNGSSPNDLKTYHQALLLKDPTVCHITTLLYPGPSLQHKSLGQRIQTISIPQHEVELFLIFLTCPWLPIIAKTQVSDLSKDRSLSFLYPQYANGNINRYSTATHEAGLKEQGRPC